AEPLIGDAYIVIGAGRVVVLHGHGDLELFASVDLQADGIVVLVVGGAARLVVAAIAQEHLGEVIRGQQNGSVSRQERRSRWMSMRCERHSAGCRSLVDRVNGKDARLVTSFETG